MLPTLSPWECISHPKNAGPQILPDRRDESHPTINVDEGINELHALEEASSIGDINNLHTLYSNWFAKQRPEPSTGIVSKDDLYLTTIRAATNDQPTSLAYLLSQGMKLDCNLIKAAVESGPTRVLQVLIDHGWNINEAEAYCEPPFLRHAVA